MFTSALVRFLPKLTVLKLQYYLLLVDTKLFCTRSKISSMMTNDTAKHTEDYGFNLAIYWQEYLVTKFKFGFMQYYCQKIARRALVKT